MRIAHSLCALVAFSSVASAQQFPATGPAPVPPGIGTRTSSVPPSPSSGQRADSLTLSRRQAIGEALAHNPLLDVAHEQTEQAKARRVTATKINDPTLDVEFDNQQHFLYGSQSIPVTLGLVFTNPFKLRHAGDAATADIHNSEANTRLQQQQLAVATSQAYDALLQALQHKRDLDSALALARDFVTKTQARFDGGSVARIDVIQATYSATSAENDLVSNARDIANAKAALNRLLGRPIRAPLAVTDSLAVPMAVPDSATVERTAMENRPEVAQAVISQEGAHANTAFIKSFWYPDLGLSLSQDYVAPATPLLSLALTMPIPFYWLHSKGDIGEAQHHELELAAATKDTRSQVAADVWTAYATANTAINQAIFVRDKLVPAAREQYRVTLASYQLGAASAFEVIQVRQSLITAQSSLTDALAAALSARADLERALGSSTDRIGAIAP